jgi:hypothetical protein
MKAVYPAHHCENSTQPLKEHLQNTACLAMRAAEIFCAGEMAYALGLGVD